MFFGVFLASKEPTCKGSNFLFKGDIGMIPSQKSIFLPVVLPSIFTILDKIFIFFKNWKYWILPNFFKFFFFFAGFWSSKKKKMKIFSKNLKNPKNQKFGHFHVQKWKNHLKKVSRKKVRALDIRRKKIGKKWKNILKFVHFWLE